MIYVINGKTYILVSGYFKEITVRLLFMLKTYGILKNMLCQI